MLLKSRSFLLIDRTIYIWNTLLCETWTKPFYIVIIVGADVLATQGARASVTMILIMSNRNNSVPARLRLMQFPEYHAYISLYQFYIHGGAANIFNASMVGIIYGMCMLLVARNMLHKYHYSFTPWKQNYPQMFHHYFLIATYKFSFTFMCFIYLKLDMFTLIFDIVWHSVRLSTIMGSSCHYQDKIIILRAAANHQPKSHIKQR